MFNKSIKPLYFAMVIAGFIISTPLQAIADSNTPINVGEVSGSANVKQTPTQKNLVPRHFKWVA
ncbi:hypothetical protein [Acidithiobacillus thiooxidans]|uniref:hypothetical protein n=1 Tax=Acidithiobacillus thiooxidans TaxID=930 RepID=UPI0011127E0F|nr:hypothetical protein [Acidithiobacillus thiooxidans]